MPPVGRQIAQLRAEAEQNDAIEEEAANAPLDETVAKAVEQAQEDYRADLQGQIANAQVAAANADAAKDAVAQEHDVEVESGECDVYDSPKLKPKPQRQRSGKLFVKRGGRFVASNSVERLIPGEKLYRHRPRTFGVAEKFIVFAVVKEGGNNHEQV
jgi:hypothetical protein